MGVGIYETTMHFFDPQTCKKPRNFLGFLGWHLFCTTLLVDDVGLEPATFRTSSGCSTS